MPGKHGEEGHSKQRGKDQEQLGIYGETQWRLSVAGRRIQVRQCWTRCSKGSVRCRALDVILNDPDIIVYVMEEEAGVLRMDYKWEKNRKD